MDQLSPELFSLLLAAVGAAAVLYATSGHGGATAYLAIFGLFSLAPAEMKPTALVMNVVVAGFGALRLMRARQTPWALLVPLLVGSIPAAYLAGGVQLPATLYRGLLGAALLVAAARLFWPERQANAERRWPAPAFVVVGVVLGAFSGLTGIGGGIFLSPLLVLLRLADPKRTAAASSVFIVVNSLSGLLAQAQSGGLAHVPHVLPWVLVVVFVGGAIGSHLVLHRLAHVGLRRALGVVLVLSGAKLLSEAL
jgi:uncharacterized membrane protein YfcA